MPIYYYNCKNCKEVTKVMHSITACLTNCEHCEAEDSLVRIPSHFASSIKQTGSKNTGDLVKEKIEEFKQDLQEEKDKLKSEEYKP
jgi:putative FmdB family regulatory protein